MNSDLPPDDLVSFHVGVSSTNEDQNHMQLQQNNVDIPSNTPKISNGDQKRPPISSSSSIMSNIPSLASIASNTRSDAASTNTVKTTQGGLRLSTFDQSISTISQVESMANGKPAITNNGNTSRILSTYHNSNGSLPSVINAVPSRIPIEPTNPIAINRKNSISRHRFDDDNLSQISTSSLATSFSKNFLLGFLNNRQKDGMKAGGLISKEYWMKDETSTECFICQSPFTTFRRKHHCRICGQIFCNKCTLLISGEKFNHNGKMRVCKTCLSFATEYNDSSDDSSLMEESYAERTYSHDHQDNDQEGQTFEVGTPKSILNLPYQTSNDNLNETHSHHFSHHHTYSSTDNSGKGFISGVPIPPPRLAMTSNRNNESTEIPFSKSFNSRISSLHTKNFGRRKTFEKPLQFSRNDQFQNLTNVPRNTTEISFAEFVDNSTLPPSSFNFTNNSGHNSAIIDTHEEGLESPIADKDNYSGSEDEGSMSIYAALNLDRPELAEKQEYKTRPARNNNTRSLERAQASLFRMRNRRKSKSGLHKSRPSLFNDSTLLTSPTVSSSITQEPVEIKSELNAVCSSHLKSLLNQELKNEGVPNIEKWEEALIPLLHDAENVEYNVRGGDNIDIRQYVKLKRLEGGKLSDTKTIDGVVFSKTLALKDMPRHISNPRIALFMFPLEYNRTAQQHFMSLEPVIAQEKEFINKLVGRIVALNPDVVFVGATVSGLALKLLYEAGIAVAYNLKPQVIERISRLTQADIGISMDKLATNLKLGVCQSLDVKTFAYKNVTKTLIFLAGCDIRLGLTILIRGGDNKLLRKIKETSEFMVYAVCNLKFETAFYRDNFVYLPPDSYGKMLESAKEENLDETRYGSAFLSTFRKSLLSISPTVKFELPYLLAKAREFEELIRRAKSDLENLELNSELSANYLSILGLSISQLPGGEVEAQKLAICFVLKKISLLENRFSTRSRQWELFSSLSPDMLELSSHQKIAFLYSMVSSKTATACIGPHNLQIDYYWDNDMTLGKYIEHLVHSANNTCPEGCGQLVGDHYRSYVHGSAKIEVNVEKSQPRTPALQNVILTWSYCNECGYTSPYLPMSEATWKFSFGKFLELMFWSQRDSVTNLGNHTHDFAKDHTKYFTYNDFTVRMKYSEIDLLDILAPRSKMFWRPNTDITLKVSLRKHIIEKSQSFFDSVSARLNRVKVDSMSNDKMEAGQKRIQQLKEQVSKQQYEVEEKIDETYYSTGATDHLPLNSTLRFVQDLSVEWDVEFAKFESDYLPSEKDVTRITTLQLKKFLLDNPEEKKEEREEEKHGEKQEKQEETPEKDQIEAQGEKYNGKERFTSGKVRDNELVTNFEEKRRSYSNIRTNDLRSISDTLTDSAVTKGNPKGKVYEEVNRFEKLKNEKGAEPKRATSVSVNDYKAVPTSISEASTPMLTPTKTRLTSDQPRQPSSVSPVERKDPFDKLNSSSNHLKPQRPRFGISASDLELQLKEGRQRSFGSATSKDDSKEDSKVTKLTNFFDQIHFETLTKEFEMQREKERLKLIQNRYKAAPVSSSRPIVEVYKNVKDAVNEEPNTAASAVDDEESVHDEKLKDEVRLEPGLKDESLKIPQTEKTSLMKTLANFWADRSATLWKPLEYPVSSSEHIFVDSDVIVREDEPSSLVAFCLSSNDYIQKIGSIRSDENQNLESIMLNKKNVHLKYQFLEGVTILSCKIFFTEQFDAFRRKCGLEDDFIQSLSRCVKWDSAGGKSGSAFLKTLDDRLVMKELSSSELDSFVKFAPSYFEYMAQALFHDLPTVIAKIFGFYQIHIKNPITGKNFKMDVIIMENLFYEKKNLRIFDLKGSMRNRHVEKTGKENEVLLDENMVEYIYENPLFVREYDKKLLRASLWNDTLFLAKMNVMDYSLVIGIDDANKTLTVGIIDCIRTFTWDKKLESWVKEKAMVGSSNKEPTIVTPRQYKNRFREAMDRYFLMVPDTWYQGK
ncbi:hypothetical protein WICMUC_004929 [Wickerhamomyces mucosus]|uniref:1-phosphatidylinositol-3-phosphate 5-kinase n=1 Tax=Wickerhamomyces mucosus TaxID=1378264 RepID=A0A9P8T8X9_9ASCO|nr:hypothetical protein WICMUC_004929 [Wickerhamomyces mucosus]